MLKNWMCILALLCLSTSVLAQGDCKYGGNYSSILAAVKSKNTRTDRHKLTPQHEENIARYWVADCKCRQGVDTMEEARALYNEAFSNKSHHTDTFLDRGNIVHKDMSGFGDLEPPFVVFTPSSCLKGSGGINNPTIGGATDCAPEASRIPDLDGQLSAYASQFFIAYCQCKAGVPNKETEKRLIATMKINYKSFNDFKNAATGALSTTPLTTCKIDPGADSGGAFGPKPLAKQNFGEIMTNNQLSRDLTGFMGALASDSNSPGLKALAQEMQKNTQTIDEIRANASIFGPLDQSSNEFLNAAENVMQAIAIGKAIFGNNKKKKAELSPSQKQVKENMGELSRKLRLIYDEVRAIPFYTTFNEETLTKLDKLERRIREFEVASANARLLYLEYIAYDGFPTLETMSQLRSKIETMSTEAVLQRIETIQSRYNTKNMPHMTNADKAFAGSMDKINLYRARSYEAMGMDDKATALRSNLSYNVDINDAIKLTQESYRHKDYYAASQYAEVVLDYFRNESTVRTLYPDMISLTYNFDGIRRFELNYLAALGVMAYAKTNQITQAKETLGALTDMHNTFEGSYENYRDNVSSRKKSFGLTDEEFRLEVMRSKAMVQVAVAQLNSIEGNYEVAESNINSAIQLYEEAPELGAQKFDQWLLYQRLEIEVNLGKYEQAKITLRELKTKERILFDESIYQKGNLGFMNALIRFKTEDYKGALFALKILQKKNPDSPKVYALEEQIYLAQGDEANAALARDNYVNSLQTE